ncbi:MAG TPA: site-specific DNA-methyltransferase, partial [Chitinophagaceae bacterium]
ARNSDTILYYSKSEEWTWNGSYKPYEENFIKTKFRKDQNGRLFRDADLGDYSEESIREFEKQGKIYITSNGNKRLIRYLDEEKGESLGDLWTDIAEVNSMADERLDYPTQKPLSLLERIIKACSNPGDLIFDCFMGSGTTQAAAMKLGRRFIGADINFGAIQTATRRLINIVNEYNCPGFAVYNVNRDHPAFDIDEEAHIEIKKDKLLITNFYPVNLLQKLNVAKNDLSEWKELIDSVMIDFNYDGAVFTPHIVDVPTDDNSVCGEYFVPASAGNIKVRITDLLSETFEKVIEYNNV